MDYDDLEIILKVIIVGSGGVGKSSLLSRYAKGVFAGEYKQTIAVDFYEKRLEIPDSEYTEIRLLLWDTAGQEEFNALTSQYYRNASGCMIVYSVTNRESFDSVRTWIDQVRRYCDDIPIVLVENKYDLSVQSTISKQESENLCNEYYLPLFKTSAKNDYNVNEAFVYLVGRMLEERNINGQPLESIEERSRILKMDDDHIQESDEITFDDDIDYDDYLPDNQTKIIPKEKKNPNILPMLELGSNSTDTDRNSSPSLSKQRDFVRIDPVKPKNKCKCT